MVKFMFIDNDFLIWLLIGGRLCNHPLATELPANQNPGLKMFVNFNKGWSFVSEVIWLRLFHYESVRILMYKSRHVLPI